MILDDARPSNAATNAGPAHDPADMCTWTTTDGRRIAYAIYGQPDGFPVLALHGTPGSRLKFAIADADARALGLCLIAVDRWAYGGTPPPPTASLVAFGDEMGRFLDGLGIGACAVLGVSGGGPYAVATAARLGRRVQALALFAPVGQVGGTPDQRGRMSHFHVVCFHGLARLPGLVRVIFAGFRWLLGVLPRLALTLATVRTGRRDRAIVRSRPVTARLSAAFIEGLRATTRGPAIDLALFRAPWQLDLAAVRARGRLWIGRADRNVPIEPAKGLARDLPGCETTVLDGDGHYWISIHADQVLAWIAREVAAEPRA